MNEFQVNLLRMIAAELYASLGIQAARELFQKSYFALSASEKGIVDGQVFAMVGSNFRALTQEALAQRVQQSTELETPRPN